MQRKGLCLEVFLLSYIKSFSLALHSCKNSVDLTNLIECELFQLQNLHQPLT